MVKKTEDRSVRKTKMTDRLETVLEKISTIPNSTNSSLIQEFHQFTIDNRKSVAMRRTTILRHSFTSHRSLRPAHCIFIESHFHPNEAADLAAAKSRASLGDAADPL